MGCERQAKFAMSVGAALIVVLAVAMPPTESRLLLVVIIAFCQVFLLWVLWEWGQEIRHVDDESGIQDMLKLVQGERDRERVLRGQVEQERKKLEQKLAMYEQDWRRERQRVEWVEQKLKQVYDAEQEQRPELDGKAQRVLTLLREHPEWTDTDIGREIGVSRQAVNVQKRILRELGYKW
jgi:hypothetical protein